MKIAISNFKGEIPRLHPHLLPDNFAQRAINARISNGALDPYRNGVLANDFGTTVQTIYKHNGTWLGYATDVDLVPGPVATDRLYYTGDGVPKLRVAGGTIYPLALAKPTVAPTVTPGGTLNTALQEDILYTYTWLTGLGEESAPAPLSATVAWSPGMTVTVAGFGTPPSGRNVTHRRIYRSQTSKAGVTDLYFVAEIPLATTSYVHNLASAPMAEVIPSLDFDTPPDSMIGLTELPGGMMAAFTGRELLFCEPFQPHAWPIKYRLKTNYPIVGLCAFGSTLAIMTTGTPYIAQGTAPENMTMERMESNLPCISARSIVDLGYAAAYASNDGLVLITPSSTQVITRSFYTKEDWRLLAPDTFFAASLESKYVFAHVAGTVTTLIGGTAALSSPDVYDAGGAANLVNPTIFNGGNPLTKGELRALGLLDLSGETPFFVDIELDQFDIPTGLYYDTSENLLYFVQSGTQAKQFDAPQAAPLQYRWRSKLFLLNGEESFGAIWVKTDNTASHGVFLKTRIYMDGTLVHETETFGAPERLPAGGTSARWEVEVQGIAAVTDIWLAGSIEEMLA